MVAKRSGVTEPFSREKIIAGVRRACQGRPVDEDALAKLGQRVEEAIRSPAPRKSPRTRSVSRSWGRSASSTRSPICDSPRSTGASSRWTTSREIEHCGRPVPRGSPVRQVVGRRSQHQHEAVARACPCGGGVVLTGPGGRAREGEGHDGDGERLAARRGKGGRKGLKIERIFTRPGVHPYDEVRWERRDVVMTNWRDGSVNFEQRGVEFPDSWSVNAANIVTSEVLPRRRRHPAARVEPEAARRPGRRRVHDDRP